MISLQPPGSDVAIARLAPWCRRVLLPKGAAFVSSCGIVAAQIALVAFEQPAPPAKPPPDILVTLVSADLIQPPLAPSKAAAVVARDRPSAVPPRSSLPDAAKAPSAAAAPAAATVTQTAQALPTSPGATSLSQTPAPAAPLARPREEDASLRLYQEEVWRMIMARRPAAVRLNGRALVAFHVMADGSPCDIAIIGPSGNPMLDRLAMEAVRRAGPFPKPPADLSADTRFQIWFQFR